VRKVCLSLPRQGQARSRQVGLFPPQSYKDSFQAERGLHLQIYTQIFRQQACQGVLKPGWSILVLVKGSGAVAADYAQFAAFEDMIQAVIVAAAWQQATKYQQYWQ